MQKEINLNPVRILYGGNIYDSWINFEKLPKTIGIRYNGLSARIKTDKVQISQRTYWKLGNYCHMFEGYDYTCKLCGLSSTAYSDSKCNCKSTFTIEEHIENIEKLNQIKEDLCKKK